MSASLQGPGTKRRAFADINVTPLVDVMLVLLIVFMVTAPLLSSALPIDLPEVAAPTSVIDAEREKPLAVDIAADGRVMLDGVELTEGSAGLEAALVERLGADPTQRPLHLRADRTVDYGVVADVIASARRAGLTGINLVVESRDERRTKR